MSSALPLSALPALSAWLDSIVDTRVDTLTDGGLRYVFTPRGASPSADDERARWKRMTRAAGPPRERPALLVADDPITPQAESFLQRTLDDLTVGELVGGGWVRYEPRALTVDDLRRAWRRLVGDAAIKLAMPAPVPPRRPLPLLAVRDACGGWPDFAPPSLPAWRPISKEAFDSQYQMRPEAAPRQMQTRVRGQA